MFGTCRRGQRPGATTSASCWRARGSELTAALPSGGDRVVLRNVVDLGQAVQPAGGGDLSADLADLEERRPGPVTVRLDPAGEQVVIGNWVFLDGLTKHSFLTGVSDVSRTRSAVLRLAGLPADVAATETAPSPVMAEAAPEETGPAEVALSGASTEAMPEMAVVSEPAPTSEEAAPIAAGWAWPPAAASPVEAAVDQAAVMPVAETTAAEMPVAEMPATEEPVQEPTAEPVLAVAEEQPVAPSPWDAFPGTTAPETVAPVGEEQVATPSPWASPEATTFEPLTTPAPARATSPRRPSPRSSTHPEPGRAGGSDSRAAAPHRTTTSPTRRRRRRHPCRHRRPRSRFRPPAIGSRPRECRRGPRPTPPVR